MIEILTFLISGVSLVKGDCVFNDAVAEYNYVTDVITMCEGKDYGKKDLAHELGHRLWFKYMGIEERLDWLVLNDYCKLSGCFSREYGMTNPEEDFATVFELMYEIDGKYYDGKLIEDYIDNKVLRYKIKFIKKIIRNLGEAN